MIIDLFYIIAGIIFLYAGAELLVRGSIFLSYKFHVPPFLIGLIIIGLGTSSPELIVSLNAALTGSHEMAAGNIIGSNISNLALILGFATLLRPVQTDKNLLDTDVPILIIATLLLALFVSFGQLTRLNGIVLLFGLIFYLWKTIHNHHAPVIEKIRERSTGRTTLLMTAAVIAGLVLLIAGAEGMIRGARELARTFELSEAVVGLSIVAVGTSLPELATAIIAAIRKQGELILGGIIGSNILNILLVLGVTATVQPLSTGDIRWPDLFLMCILTVLLWLVLRTGLLVNRLEGALLLVIYTGYLVYLFLR